MSWHHLRNTQRKARQAHRCWLCSRPIEPGSKYVEIIGVFYDELQVTRTHEACEVITRDWQPDDWESTSEGDLLPYLEELEAAEAAGVNR